MKQASDQKQKLRAVAKLLTKPQPSKIQDRVRGAMVVYGD